MEKLRIIELFAGIGACSKALTRLGIEHEVVDAVEIDKYAIKSFNVIHNTNFETQDITKWDKDIKDVDLIMHGSPCQDFSIAGKQAGGDLESGTRSSLMYETVRIVGKLRPKYVIWENVKNILSKKHKHNFDDYIDTLSILGYNSYYQVLNAKNYGIPQNRDRVYTVSIRKDIDKNSFKFPEKQELEIRLKDVLEKVVDDKYYLKEKGLKYVTKRLGKYTQLIDDNTMIAHCPITAVGNINWTGNFVTDKIIQVGKLDIKGQDNVKRVYSQEGLSPTLTNMQGGNRQPKIIIGSTQANAAVNKNGICPTLTTSMGTGGGHVPMHNYDYKIRKLTPKECWRLMGFDDEDFEKATKINSNTQLYKQAGNSIVVNVLEKILKNLLKE